MASDLKVIKSFSLPAGDVSTRMIEKFDFKRTSFTAGWYAVGLNFKLKNDKGNVLEAKRERISGIKKNVISFTVDVAFEGTTKKTAWIIDRWPQPNFPNDFNTAVKSAVINLYSSYDGKDSLWQTSVHAPLVILASSEMKKKKGYRDTTFWRGTIQSVSSYNRNGQPATTAWYGKNNVIVWKKVFTYRHARLKETRDIKADGSVRERVVYAYRDHYRQLIKRTYNEAGKLKEEHRLLYQQERCTEDTWTLYAERGDPYTITDHFIYDEQGRIKEEQYYLKDGKPLQTVLYEYSGWDEKGNWQKAVRMDNGKLTNTVTRNIVYE